MRLGFNCLLGIIFYLLLPLEAMSQSNTVLPTQKNTKITLISPLDLLYKIPESQKSIIIKQRSIFDAEKLPLFCKIEHKLSKKSNVND